MGVNVQCPVQNHAIKPKNSKVTEPLAHRTFGLSGGYNIEK